MHHDASLPRDARLPPPAPARPCDDAAEGPGIGWIVIPAVLGGAGIWALILAAVL